MEWAAPTLTAAPSLGSRGTGHSGRWCSPAGTFSQNTRFLSIYYVPGTLLGAKDTAVNKTDTHTHIPPSWSCDSNHPSIQQIFIEHLLCAIALNKTGKNPYLYSIHILRGDIPSTKKQVLYLIVLTAMEENNAEGRRGKWGASPFK